MPARQAAVEKAQQEIDVLRENVMLLLHGGELNGWKVHAIASLGPDIDNVLNNDACAILLQAWIPWYTPEEDYYNCSQGFDGAYTNSYYSVVIKYADLAQNILNNIPLTNASREEILFGTHFVRDIGTLMQFENPFFRNITKEINHRAITAMHENLEGTLSHLTTLSILFVVLFSVFSLVVYVPMIRATGRHVAATQAVLLMFDDKQLTDIPSLKAEVKAMLLHTPSAKAGRLRSKIAVLELLFTMVGWFRARLCVMKRGGGKSFSKAGSKVSLDVDANGRRLSSNQQISSKTVSRVNDSIQPALRQPFQSLSKVAPEIAGASDGEMLSSPDRDVQKSKIDLPTILSEGGSSSSGSQGTESQSDSDSTPTATEDDEIFSPATNLRRQLMHRRRRSSARTEDGIVIGATSPRDSSGAV
jgi:hypothetical protein